MKRIFNSFIAVLTALVIFSLNPANIYAQTADPNCVPKGYGCADEETLRNLGIYFVSNVGIGVCSANSAGGTPVNTKASQEEHAKTIIGIAKTLNLGKQGALIGIMTALAETTLKNYANDNPQYPQLGPISKALPHDAVGHDHDSVGLFQQRAVEGNWSPVDGKKDLAGAVKWLMNPAYSAEAFFAMPVGKKDRKALVNVSNWQAMDPWMAAQKVQVSFDETGGNYKARLPAAQALIDKLFVSSPAIPLPVPLASAGPATPQPTVDNPANLDCPGGTGEVGDLKQTIKAYAHPEYHQANYFPFMPAYAAAVKAVTSGNDKGGYVGGGAHPGTDCGGFVTTAMRNSKADPEYNKNRSNVVAQARYLRTSGKYEEIKGVTSPGQLKFGDIFINASESHTYFFVGSELGADFKGNAASASFSTTGRSWRAPMASETYFDGGSASWFRLKAPPAASGGGVQTTL